MNSGIGILSRQILFASFFWSLFVLPGISPAEAYTESWTINGVCDKKATSGNCYHFSDITRNNAQAYEVSVTGHAEGHGAFGVAGGRVSVAFCLSGSGIAWDGSCMYALSDTRIGDGDYILPLRKLRIEGNYNLAYSRSWIEVYANDATWDRFSATLSGRKVQVDLDGPANVQVGQNFTIEWDAEPWGNNTRILYEGAGISCQGKSSGANIGTSGSLVCSATSIGTAYVTVYSDGPSASGYTTASSDLEINVTTSIVDLNFLVKNQDNLALPGATVTIGRDFGNGTTRTTDGGGFANFGVNSNTTVSYSVTRSSCNTVSNTVNSGATGNTVNISLNCSSAPSVCSDPTANNFGGTLPCTHSSSTLNLTLSVSGPGTVTSNVGNCRGGTGSNTCTFPGIPYNTPLTLRALSDAGATFNGWGDSCYVFGSNSTCQGPLTTNARASASFSGASTPPTPSNITFNITYIPNPFDYSLSNGGSVVITKSGSVSYGQGSILSTLTTGTPQGVDLDLSGLPSGVSYSISNRTCTPSCTSTITFGVDPGTTAGIYPITVTGSPLNKQTSFNLVVNQAPASTIIVSCSVSPLRALINTPITWSATVTGGTPPYRYSWSGSGFPTNPAPSSLPYTHRYSTLGDKTATLTVTDSENFRGTCEPTALTEIYFRPVFEEF